MSMTLGAQLVETDVDGIKVSGVRFAVYAPSATSVSLIGDFNFWDGRRHPMQRSLCGHWVLFVPGLQAGDHYKFELKRIRWGIVCRTRPIPWASMRNNIHHFSSVVYDHTQYQWHDADWQAAAQRQAGTTALYL